MLEVQIQKGDSVDKLVRSIEWNSSTISADDDDDDDDIDEMKMKLNLCLLFAVGIFHLTYS
jgi:hypothetical protein